MGSRRLREDFKEQIHVAATIISTSSELTGIAIV